MRGAVLLALAAIAGCQPPTANESQQQAIAAAASAASAVAAIQQLNEKVSSIDQRLKRVELDKTIRELSEVNVAWFDPQGPKGYAAVKSPAGPVLLVLDNIQPYLDGFTVTFRVGNPTTAAINGVKGKITWGPLFDASKPLLEP